MQRIFLTFLFLAGCSAVVNPDPSLLGDPGSPMGCSTDCSDGVECTVDRCDGRVCVNERDNSQCADSERCDMLMGCVDASCTTNANCDDGLACNGVETCESGRCAEGTPVVCDDGIECTMERCDDTTGLCQSRADDAFCDDGVPCTADSCSEMGCVNTPNNALCDDGFCFQGAVCTPEGCQGGTATDCTDGDACTVDSCDAAALACVNEIVDADGDTFSPTLSCAQVDCNDDDPLIYPGAPEICDAIDQDCDGDTTDGCDPMLPDTCDTALLLPTVGAEPVMLDGSFAMYAADYSQRCSDSRRPDVVFALDLEAGRDYIVDTLGSRADTILAVSSECGTWDFAGRGCNDDIDSDNRQSRLFLRGLGNAPGLTRVYILLTQFDDSSDAGWVLNVRSLESQGNMCQDQLDISAGGSVVGYIAPSASTFYVNGCQGGSFMTREHFFHITTPGGEEVQVRSWSDDFNHSVARYGQCNRGARQCDGAAAGDRSQLTWNPDRGDQMVLIDGSNGSEGDFYTLRYNPSR